MTDNQATQTPGQVGYLAEGGKLVAVRVDSASEGKLLTHSIDAKERRVAPRRLLWTSQVSVENLKALAAHWSRTCEAGANWDAEGAWTHLSTHGQLDPVDAKTLNTLLPAPFCLETEDAVVLAVFDDPLHFRMRAGLIHPTSVVAMAAAKAEAAEAAKRAESLERAVTALEAMLANEPVPSDVQSDADTHIAYLELVALHGEDTDSSALAASRTLLDALARNGQGDARHYAFALLRSLGVFTENENLALRREGLSVAFSPELISAATQAAANGWSRADRTDLTGLHTVAIDAVHTTEVDDAFAIDGNRIVVFIADTDSLVPTGSAVDIEAKERISTVYLPERVVPMLPEVLGQEAASLVVDEDRPVLAMSFRVDGDGGLVDFRIEEAICRLNTHLPYTRVDELLKGQAETANRTEGAMVRTAQRMMKAHRGWRVGRGALQLQRSEVEFAVAEDGTVEVESVEANGPARQLISEMMICICAGAATWCADRGVPSVFRCQARPTEGGRNPKGEVVNPAEQAQILRGLQPTVLTTEAGLHYTLALDAYVQVSSPLRRYGDLVMHRQLKATLRGEPAPYDAEMLRTLCQHIERRTGSVRRVEHESRRFWTLKHLSQNPDTVRTAVCVRPVGHRWLVAIESLAQRALIRTRRRLHQGLALAVVVDKVDARRNKVVMREAE